MVIICLVDKEKLDKVGTNRTPHGLFLVIISCIDSAAHVKYTHLTTPIVTSKNIIEVLLCTFKHIILNIFNLSNVIRANFWCLVGGKSVSLNPHTVGDIKCKTPISNSVTKKVFYERVQQFQQSWGLIHIRY